MNSKLDLVVVIPESEEGRRSFDRLVKAAEDLFSQQGYRSTTIKDIAQSAGLSVGAFYIYFRSKYQIYVYIMQSFALRLQNYLDSRAGKITGDLIERQVWANTCDKRFCRKRRNRIYDRKRILNDHLTVLANCVRAKDLRPAMAGQG